MNRTDFMIASTLAFGLLLSVGLLGAHSLALLAIAAILDLMLFRYASPVSRRGVFVVTAIAGPCAEIVAIHFGAWTYTFPLIAGIPIWLPLVWGGAGLYISILSNHLSAN